MSRMLSSDASTPVQPLRAIATILHLALAAISLILRPLLKGSATTRLLQADLALAQPGMAPTASIRI